MINITTSSQITKIYLVTNCFGYQNKIYIGKTTSSRENDHKKTYGKDIIYTEIEEVNSLEYKDWEPLESFWIEYFRYLGFEIQNKRMKGGSGPTFYSDESKLKMSNSHKGKIFSQEHKDKISNSKFDISQETREKMSKYARNRSQEHRDKIILANKGKKRTKETCDKMSKSMMGVGNKIILQYDLEGNFIKEWPSITSAGNFIGHKSGTPITNCCKGRQITAGNYKWKYK